MSFVLINYLEAAILNKLKNLISNIIDEIFIFAPLVLTCGAGLVGILLLITVVIILVLGGPALIAYAIIEVAKILSL